MQYVRSIHYILAQGKLCARTCIPRAHFVQALVVRIVVIVCRRVLACLLDTTGLAAQAQA